MGKNKKIPLQTGYYYRENKSLIIPLFILYAAFCLAASIKMPFFWGINYLYYFPGWVKGIFLISGGLCFFPEINSMIYGVLGNIVRVIERIDNYKKRNIVLGIAFYLLFAAAAGFLFYYFRVYSLYHAPMGAIYFMERNIPILDYYKNYVLVEDKYILLFVWGGFRYLFKQVFGLSNYKALAGGSIVFGVAFVMILGYFVRKLKEYSGIERLLIACMLFCQAITYYYFGFANYYAPVPFVIFAYAISVILFFRGNAGISLPLSTGVLAIIVHLGTVFILPSLIFLVIYRFRDSFSPVYNILSFRNPKITIAVLISTIVMVYSVIALLMPGSKSLSEYFVPPFKISARYGFPLFSADYLIHLANMLILSSPVGVLLFIIYIRDIKDMGIFGDGKYVIVWIAIGGVLHHVFLLPQTIFAWDVYSWTSIGLILSAVFFFIHSERKKQHYAYSMTLIFSHSLIYFSAWMVMNTNVYASVINYLDTAQKYNPQLSWCLEIMGEDIRDRKEIERTAKALESRIENAGEYMNLARLYHYIENYDRAGEYFMKYLQLLREKIVMEPNNAAEHIYNMIRVYEQIPYFAIDMKDRELAYLYDKLCELGLDNVYYSILCGNYYVGKREYDKALKIYLHTDSLYQHNDPSLFATVKSHSDIKGMLSQLLYNKPDYARTISYFEEAIELGMNAGSDLYSDCVLRYLNSFAYLGNIKKLNSILGKYENILENKGVKSGQLKDSDFMKNRMTISSLCKGKIENSLFDEFYGLYKYANEDSLYAEFYKFHDIFRLLDGKYEDIYNEIKGRGNENGGYSLLRVLSLIGMSKYPEALSVIREDTYIKNRFFWLEPYIYVIEGDRQKLGSWINQFSKISNKKDAENSGLKLIAHLYNMHFNYQDGAMRDASHYTLLPKSRQINGDLNGDSINSGILDTLFANINSNMANILINTWTESYSRKKETYLAEILGLMDGNKYIEFLDYMKNNPPNSEIMDSSILNSQLYLFAEGDIFGHAQQLIVSQDYDSVRIFGEKLTDAFPSLFEGHFLLGVYYKAMEDFARAREHFYNASERIEESVIIPDKKAAKKRIETIMSDMER